MVKRAAPWFHPRSKETFNAPNEERDVRASRRSAPSDRFARRRRAKVRSRRRARPRPRARRRRRSREARARPSAEGPAGGGGREAEEATQELVGGTLARGASRAHQRDPQGQGPAA